MIDQKIKNILANLNQMYLQTQKETQQFQAFYFVKYQPQLIQFNQYLIIDNHSQIHWIEIGSIQIVVLRIILSSKYYILGVHLINNLIIEQILIEDQISILNKIDLNDYEIIRPLEYQINYYYNYLAIATKKLTKTYILLFAVSIKFPLKQYKIIEIGRVQFFFVQEFLFYYDQDDNIYKYNTKDFEIQIDNLLLEQNDLTNIKQIQFQIIPINSNDSIMNVEISIKSYNECFKLLKKQNDVLLKFISQKELKFNINDYIYGPINNVQIINNNHIKIQGPMLLYEIINNQEILKDAKLQTINLGSQFPGVQNIINIILFKYKSNLIILFDKSIQSQIKNKAHLQNIIQFNDKSLLVLFLNKNRNEIRGSIHMINETTLQLESEPIFEIIINFPLHFNCQSFKTGNLIIIKAQNTIDIYQIIGYSIQQIQNHLNILEILKIKGNNELYISLSLNTKNNQQILLFQILSLDQLEFQVKGTASLTWNSMDIVLKNQIYLHPNQKLNYDYQLIFLECSIADEKLQITILQAFQEYLVICEIIIFMEDFKISYRPIKILRNPENLNQDLEYEYFNQNNLILKQFNLIYFYDLLEQSNLYHYIGKQFLERQYLFHQFNTTHFIVYDCIQQKMFFANIGYLIKINDEVLENQVFTLIAENKVSSIQLQISLEVFNDQIQNQNFITKFFLFFVYYQFCIFFQEE
ncbi:unnamed protein product [Paramecium sonneborni]|uniref:Uncharacterized protein n=1 Tax=Paramecium sonneborni TaxID=65129 RepID=A0A8S1PZ48_9CILI|nr:unnamed protein product [Paramecium sonneborni]